MECGLRCRDCHATLQGMDPNAIRRAAFITLHRAICERIQHTESDVTVWTHRSGRSQNQGMPLELSDAELATAATACRAMAFQEGERARTMENPSMRGPVEDAARRYAALAEKLEAARKGGAAVA